MMLLLKNNSETVTVRGFHQSEHCELDRQEQQLQIPWVKVFLRIKLPNPPSLSFILKPCGP